MTSSTSPGQERAARGIAKRAGNRTCLGSARADEWTSIRSSTILSSSGGGMPQGLRWNRQCIQRWALLLDLNGRSPVTTLGDHSRAILTATGAPIVVFTPRKRLINRTQ
jgi:hypothetical protein